MNVFLKQISPEHEVFRSRIEAGQRFTIGGSELSNEVPQFPGASGPGQFISNVVCS